MSLESAPILISGETAIVHVPVARAAAIRHVARKWNSLTVHRLATAGQHPAPQGFNHYGIVPHGHEALQISWRQRTPDDPRGVPLAFHQEANILFMKHRAWWYAVALWGTYVSPVGIEPALSR
ncbi:MAG: hypothetical protein AAB542_00870 [Patescibacteria group bacterium]